MPSAVSLARWAGRGLSGRGQVCPDLTRSVRSLPFGSGPSGRRNSAACGTSSGRLAGGTRRSVRGGTAFRRGAAPVGFGRPSREGRSVTSTPLAGRGRSAALRAAICLTEKSVAGSRSVTLSTCLASPLSVSQEGESRGTETFGLKGG